MSDLYISNCICVEVDSSCIANGRHVVRVSEININYLTKNADKLHLKVLQ